MEVQDRIRAVYVLQRFVKMSRQLLPRFSELMSKETHSQQEETKINRIKDVYESFQTNSDFSMRLINSNIFQLIKEVYGSVAKGEGQTPQTFYSYNRFLEESDRLIETWNKQSLN